MIELGGHVQDANDLMQHMGNAYIMGISEWHYDLMRALL